MVAVRTELNHTKLSLQILVEFSKLDFLFEDIEKIFAAGTNLQFRLIYECRIIQKSESE